MKKVYLILNILFGFLILVGDVLYITVNHSLLTKSIVSLCFVVLGIVNFIYLKNKDNKNLKFGIFMLTGLIFAFAGDVVLEIVFEMGAGLFAIGHIFYFVAYCQLIGFKSKDLLPAVIIILPMILFVVFSPLFDFGGLFMELVVISYAIIISLMVGKSISNFMQMRNLLNLVILIGSVLFMFSDFMLLFSNFADVSRVFAILCLATYYPAQLILAGSLIFACENNNIKLQK